MQEKTTIQDVAQSMIMQLLMTTPPHLLIPMAISVGMQVQRADPILAEAIERTFITESDEDFLSAQVMIAQKVAEVREKVDLG